MNDTVRCAANPAAVTEITLSLASAPLQTPSDVLQWRHIAISTFAAWASERNLYASGDKPKVNDDLDRIMMTFCRCRALALSNVAGDIDAMNVIRDAFSNVQQIWRLMLPKSMHADFNARLPRNEPSPRRQEKKREYMREYMRAYKKRPEVKAAIAASRTAKPPTDMDPSNPAERAAIEAEIERLSGMIIDKEAEREQALAQYQTLLEEFRAGGGLDGGATASLAETARRRYQGLPAAIATLRVRIEKLQNVLDAAPEEHVVVTDDTTD